jgi:ABC-type sugar transport system permease subunit
MASATTHGTAAAPARGKSAFRRLMAALSAPLLLTPSIGVMVLVILWPSFELLWLSFTNYSPGLGGEFVGLDNYLFILTDKQFLDALVRNIFFVAIVVALEVGLGFAIALLLQYKFPLKRVWLALLLTPFAVSPIVAVTMWKYMLDPTFGIVNYVFSLLHIQPIMWLTTGDTSMAAIIIVAVWKEFAFTTIIMYAALSTVPKELMEAASIDGTTAVQRFFHVTLPLVLPALVVVTLFRVIFTMREFAIPYTMTKGGPGTATEILSIYLYKQAYTYSDYGTGAAVGWIILLVTLACSIFLVRRGYKGMFLE